MYSIRMEYGKIILIILIRKTNDYFIVCSYTLSKIIKDSDVTAKKDAHFSIEYRLHTLATPD